MTPTTYGTNDLVKLPGRAIRQVDDGIVELSCTFACKTSLAGTFRALFENGKPVPQESGFIINNGVVETTRGDGFTEFSVTATGEIESGGSFGREGLKAQSEISVQNFPSGLIRVEQKVICKTSDELKFFQNISAGNVFETDVQSDAPFYIYPNPTIIRRIDGFTEFGVTAYSKREIAPRPIERQLIKSTYTIYRETDDGISETTRPSLNETYTLRYVLETDAPANAIASPPEIITPAVYTSDGTLLKEGQIPLGKSEINGVQFELVQFTEINIILENFTSTCFGYWTEYIVAFKAEASQLTLLQR